MKLQIEITPEQNAILQRRARRADLELNAFSPPCLVALPGGAPGLAQ